LIHEQKLVKIDRILVGDGTACHERTDVFTGRGVGVACVDYSLKRRNAFGRIVCEIIAIDHVLAVPRAVPSKVSFIASGCFEAVEMVSAAATPSLRAMPYRALRRQDRAVRD